MMRPTEFLTLSLTDRVDYLRGADLRDVRLLAATLACKASAEPGHVDGEHHARFADAAMVVLAAALSDGAVDFDTVPAHMLDAAVRALADVAEVAS
jgi:hypothetical protein